VIVSAFAVFAGVIAVEERLPWARERGKRDTGLRPDVQRNLKKVKKNLVTPAIAQ
jgi:hypothetical protein